jgi:hypothetical protein
VEVEGVKEEIKQDIQNIKDASSQASKDIVTKLKSNRHKQALIEDIKKEGEKKYKVYQLFEEDTEKFIEAYQANYLGSGYVPVKSEKVEDYGRGGVLVMEKTNSGSKLLWNSIFDMREVPMKIEVRDINKDGVKEILSYWQAGKFDVGLWIFSYNRTGKSFHLITPIFKYQIGGDRIVLKLSELENRNFSLNEIRSLHPLFAAQDIQVKDFDNDQIDEVKIIELDDYRQDSPNEAEYPHMKNTKIYKWNGEEFYLWQDKTSKNTGASDW